MNLPDCQNELVQKVLEVQKHVVVVLHNGSAVVMPWKDQVEGILEAYLGGEAVGKRLRKYLQEERILADVLQRHFHFVWKIHHVI